MNASLQGSATIRAFNASGVLEKEFHEFQDHNTSTFYLYISATRWFAVSLDLLCLAFIAIVTYSFLLMEDCKFTNKSDKLITNIRNYQKVHI